MQYTSEPGAAVAAACGETIWRFDPDLGRFVPVDPEGGDDDG